MKRPTVAIDVRTAEHTGIGRYTRHAVAALAMMDTGLRLLALANPRQDLGWLPAAGAVEPFRLRCGVPLYSPLEHVVLPVEIRRSGCDLVHFTNFNTPAYCPAPYVVTIHDTIYLCLPWDCASRARAIYARHIMRHSARCAAHIVTISYHSQRDIESLLHVRPERITVGYCGAWEPERMPAPSESDLAAARAHAPYVLYVGNQNPHKNLAQLAAAVQIVRQRHPKLKLLAVGKLRRHYDALARELARRGLDAVVEFPGAVSDEMLVALYRGADVVATASLYEGFGLPVLEAFVAGAPVVSSNRSSLPEVAGDAALLADPDDLDAFAAAIESVLDNPGLRQQLVRRGRERAKQFSWQRLARLLAEVYRQALS